MAAKKAKRPARTKRPRFDIKWPAHRPIKSWEVWLVATLVGPFVGKPMRKLIDDFDSKMMRAAGDWDAATIGVDGEAREWMIFSGNLALDLARAKRLAVKIHDLAIEGVRVHVELRPSVWKD